MFESSNIRIRVTNNIQCHLGDSKKIQKSRKKADNPTQVLQCRVVSGRVQQRRVAVGQIAKAKDGGSSKKRGSGSSSSPQKVAVGWIAKVKDGGSSKKRGSRSSS
jgi:hypothetical protein